MNRTLGDQASSAISSDLLDFLTRATGPAFERVKTLTLELLSSPSITAERVVRTLRREPAITDRLIRAAERLGDHSVEPCASVDAAVERLGAQRAAAWLVALETARALTADYRGPIDPIRFWQTSLARGCLAAAIASNRHVQHTGAAFLVGCLQDAALLPLSAEYPDVYRSLLIHNEDCSTQLAILEWQSFNFNHIHVGVGLLRRLGLAPMVIDAIGRHHTNPPVGATREPALALWQIGFLVGAVSLKADRAGRGSAATASGGESVSRRFMTTAFQATGPGLSVILHRAEAEYEALAEFFEPVLVGRRACGSLFVPLAEALGAPRDDRVAVDRSDELSFESAGPRAISASGARPVTPIGADLAVSSR